MATALTQAWQTVATGNSSFTYGGNTYYITVYLQAYYEPYSATQAKIHLRELLSTSSSVGWFGTNKHYRVRFYPYENPPEDSGYNQDSTQWYEPGSSYYLPDSSGTVTHIIDYEASIDIVAYYLVDVAPSSEVDIMAQVYAPSPVVAPATPTISSRTIASNSVDITYGTTSFGTPSTGTVTLYGGTTANPTTAIDTYNATGDHTFTHTGLTPNTTYYYRARANNGQLDSNYSTEISVTTPLDKGLYGSVNGEAKRITKLYGSVVKEYYHYVITDFANNNVNYTRFNNEYINTYHDLYYKIPRALKVVTSGLRKYVSLVFTDNSHVALFNYSGTYTNQGVAWGFQSAPVNGAATSYKHIDGLFNVAKQITKLYGSVNGVTKQIF